MRTPTIVRLSAAALAGLMLASTAAVGGAGPAAASRRPAPTCEGAVLRTVQVRTLPSTPLRLCITVGGVLRMQGSGPGTMTATPRSRVDCFYAGGVHQCRLLRTGPLRLTFSEGQTRRVFVTVARATRPPKPSPACLPRQTVFPVDGTENGMPWWAECMKVGAVVRFENLGPGRLSVTPRRAVSCRYAAGVHSCRLRSAATVRFLVRGEVDTRPFIVVAIR